MSCGARERGRVGSSSSEGDRRVCTKVGQAEKAGGMGKRMREIERTASYSQTRKFQKALDYVMSRRAWATGLSDDVCKYRSSMINCSCQATRYFARAYRNPFIVEVRIPHIISPFSPTVEAAPRRVSRRASRSTKLSRALSRRHCRWRRRRRRRQRRRRRRRRQWRRAATECGLAIPPTSLSFAAATAANFNGIVALSPQNDSAARDLLRR